MKTNKKPVIHTHEGGVAKNISPEQQLRRSVMSCLLWEDTFYEDGVSIAKRIQTLIPKVDPNTVASMAYEARTQQYLRHVPLLLCRELARLGKLRAITLENVIQRADELTEFLSLYWLEGKCPLSKQVKLGLSRAFNKFDAYQLAKYNRDGTVKLRDVLFMTHPKPKDALQADTWKALVNGTLPPPDTWEVGLSSGADKRETFTRLLSENRLGYMALLRNLRNMLEAKVDKELIKNALLSGAENSKVLPFRFISAASHAPQLEPFIDKAMQLSLKGMPKLPGKTLLLLDHSGSMQLPLSTNSELQRRDAAAGLAILLSGIAEDLAVYSFSTSCTVVPLRKGMALKDAYYSSLNNYWGGTIIPAALKAVDDGNYDRLIVLTDEQTVGRTPDPQGRGYMINISTNTNGVGYGKWIHIDGWSESVVKFISELENTQ